MRYTGPFNFVGRPIAGYDAPHCLLTQPAAEALAGVQADLRPYGYGLKVYDCYRPARAVADFVRWGQDVSDTRMKAAFYPHIDKANVFRLGYIATKSSHSRGSTVDLTLIPLRKVGRSVIAAKTKTLPSCLQPRRWRRLDNSLDMGTAFDCFDERAHTDAPGLPAVVVYRRNLLRETMTRHGFRNLPEEWWHYTLRDEPYPDTAFDFPIQ